jgi:hypothetical protein
MSLLIVNELAWVQGAVPIKIIEATGKNRKATSHFFEPDCAHLSEAQITASIPITWVPRSPFKSACLRADEALSAIIVILRRTLAFFVD